MKYYKKICIDIATGKVLEAETFDYEGPIAHLGGGKSKTTTTVNIPPPTAEETRAKAISNLVNEANLNTLGYNITDDGSGNLSLVQRALTAEEQEQKDFDAKLQQQIRQRIMGGPVDPETKALVGQTFEASRARGNRSLEDFVRQIAGSRGLDFTDSPILKELAQGKANLELGLGGAEAASLLDQGNRQQLFAASLDEFQKGLQQQAMINRMNVGGAYSNTGSQLAALRGMQTTTTQQTSGGGGGLFGPIMGGLGAAGGFMQGLGALGAFSSRDFKENIEPANLDTILDEIAATPIYTWNYKPEFGDSRRHIGPVIEEASPRISEGKVLVPIDYMGYLFGAIKKLNEKVKAIEAQNGTV